MRTTWVKKRVYLEAPDEQALARSVCTFEEALRARRGAILKLWHERLPSSRRSVKISYTLPIEHN